MRVCTSVLIRIIVVYEIMSSSRPPSFIRARFSLSLRQNNFKFFSPSFCSRVHTLKWFVNVESLKSLFGAALVLFISSSCRFFFIFSYIFIFGNYFDVINVLAWEWRLWTRKVQMLSLEKYIKTLMRFGFNNFFARFLFHSFSQRTRVRVLTCNASLC